MNRSKRLAFSACVVLAACAGSRVVLAQAEPEETPVDEQQSATSRALSELAAAYEGLSGLLDQGSDEAVERVQEDIENLGDWEYRIIEFEEDSTESLESELNLLGNERWEVYWVEPTRDGIRFYLKRPSISYLSRVPLSTLMRMFVGGGE